MRYATLTQLKDEVSVKQDDTSQDAYLQNLLDGVSAWVDTFTGQRFGEIVTVVDELYQGKSASFYLRRIGITEVDEIKVKYWQGDSYITLDPNQYEWDPFGRIILYVYPDPFAYGGAAFAYGGGLYQGVPRFVQVSYKYGAEGIPGDINIACLNIAGRLHRAHNINGVQSERLGDQRIDYKDIVASAGDDLKILEAYRIRQL